MARIEEFSDVREKELVRKLIKENIDKQWIRDLLLSKKGIGPSGGQGDFSLVENFMYLIWDNLTEEQQNKVIEFFNLIVEEDLFLEKQPEYGYWSDLLDFAILLHKKLRGKINIRPFVIWKEKNYPNLMNSSEKVHPSFIQKLNQKIETAFLKK